jgi:ferrochelatase
VGEKLKPTGGEEKRRAILLANMGGARSAGELKEFLFNMFKDKRIVSSPIRFLLAPLISQLRYKNVWENYKKIGGSRIYSLTEELAKEMEELSGRPVLIGMRYTQPYLPEVLKELDEVTILPLYPHYSVTTYGSTIDGIKEAFQGGWRGSCYLVPPYFDDPYYNRSIADHILNNLPKESKEYHLIFSAHGLPEKLVKRENDPYPTQVEKQVEILKGLIGNRVKSVSLAYQSRFGIGKWLTPYLNEELEKMTGKKVVIYPISFIIDNSETDLELNIEYRHLARRVGLEEYKVIPAPNRCISHTLLQLVERFENHHRQEFENTLSKWLNSR